MKHVLLATVALAGLMEEAGDGTTGSAGGVAAEQPKAEPKADDTVPQAETAPNVADTSGDTDHQPAGAHLDAPAAGPVEGEAVAQPVPEKTDDELANAFNAGNPKVALVGKYTDRIPVQLKSQAHLEKLQADHGGAVEVQS